MTMFKRSFDSLRALTQYCEGPAAEDANNASQSDDRGFSWDGGMSYAETIKTGLMGGYWPEGAGKLMAAVAPARRALDALPVPSLDYDVHGHTLDVDEYLSGSPECWIADYPEEDAPAPVIKIGLSMHRRADVGAGGIFNYGAAIVSMIEALEAQGSRCELWVIDDSVGSSQCTDFRVCIKPASDDWNSHTVSFAIMHPAFSRKLGFKLMEREDGLQRMTHSGYGRGGAADAEIRGQFDVWLKNIGYGVCESSVATPEDAMAKVSEIFTTQMEGEE